MKTIMTDIEKWKHLSNLQETSGDQIACPECKDQVAFCDCPQRLAHDILDRLTEKKLFIIPYGDRLILNVRIKEDLR